MKKVLYMRHLSKGSLVASRGLLGNLVVPLTERAIEIESPQIVKWLEDNGYNVQITRIVTSPTVRAQHTGWLIAEALGMPLPAVTTSWNAFGLTNEVIFQDVTAQDDDGGLTLFVGHYDGEIGGLTACSPDAFEIGKTTGAICLFGFEAGRWADAQLGTAEILDSFVPSKE